MSPAREGPGPAVGEGLLTGLEVLTRANARFRKDRMKVALVAGIHPVANDRLWAVVARNGQPTVVLREARLFFFTKAGKETGSRDSSGPCPSTTTSTEAGEARS